MRYICFAFTMKYIHVHEVHNTYDHAVVVLHLPSGSLQCCKEGKIWVPILEWDMTGSRIDVVVVDVSLTEVCAELGIMLRWLLLQQIVLLSIVTIYSMTFNNVSPPTSTSPTTCTHTQLTCMRMLRPGVSQSFWLCSMVMRAGQTPLLPTSCSEAPVGANRDSEWLGMGKHSPSPAHCQSHHWATIWPLLRRIKCMEVGRRVKAVGYITRLSWYWTVWNFTWLWGTDYCSYHACTTKPPPNK